MAERTFRWAPRRRQLRGSARALIAGFALAALPPPAANALTASNNTPFAGSTVLAGAHWASARHGPPRNQFGDILPISWADDNQLYVLIDDGATDGPGNGALWRNSFARITGAPLRNLRFRRIGPTPPAATWSQIRRNKSLWSGTLGSYYATGFTAVDHTFYATQVNDWSWGQNGLFQGLAGVAYSTNRGSTWHFPGKPFPGPTGNLNWVQYGRDADAPDGYMYAISTEREFNATTLLLGRSRPDIADMTNPRRWQWASGWDPTPTPWPRWSRSLAAAVPVLSWPGHITYPRMTFDPGLRRYLLTFTYSYASAPPALWQNGSELVLLDAPHPWGPFTFVARQPYFGASNGYDPEIPVKWISNHGQYVWLVWAANFDGCARGLSCAGAYGFNYQRIHLLPSSRQAARRAATASQLHPRASATAPRAPRADDRVPATKPRFALPRLYLSPGP